NSSIVNTAIGLFIVYFLMGSMASVVSEIIGMFLQRRSSNMAQFIVDMFHEQQNPYRPNATSFYASPIFQLKEIGGFMGVVAAIGQKVLRWLHHWKWIPKWIPSGVPVVNGSDQILSISTSNFSQAVFEVLNFATDADRFKTFENLRRIVTDTSQNALLQE